MSDFKKCANGHYYPNTEAMCPYCPKTGYQDVNSDAATVAMSGSDKTQIFNQRSAPKENFNPNATQIIGSGLVMEHQQMTGGENGPANSGRKLAAWIVTFDNNPYGRDFHIYEGRNTIGYGKGNDIVVDFDNSVSTHHLTIRYHHLDGFSFKDEMSSNGTYVNGKFTSEGKLSDGDKIKIGNLTFLLRTTNI